ncbi:hypothetical protein [Nocardioides sp. B-3]|uniref:hypothetical protein n=1 Tax=Nocardioides sp. B-3 TaxID=2895565 RepID=UPI0021535C56|nr:hypothetical protein [Nocardioides sp. B-3]UUZ58171.1 hypothetical protein LP418_18105 [Nocardioides sp. B-3]
MRLNKTLLAVASSAVLVAAVATSAPAVAAKGGKGNTVSTPTWAPAETATITPGVQMYTDGAQCTANFVYTDGSGRHLRRLRGPLRRPRCRDRHQRL